MTSTLLLSYLPGLSLSLVLRSLLSVDELETIALAEDGDEPGEYAGVTVLANVTVAVAVMASANKLKDSFAQIGADEGVYRIGLIQSAGSGGLSPEQQAQLDAIEAKTALLTSGSRAHVIDSVLPGGDLVLHKGDDYLTAADNVLLLPVSDAGGVLAAELTTAGLANLRFGAGRPGRVEEITGTISAVDYDGDEETTISIEIAKEAITGPHSEDFSYVYQIRRLDGSGRRVKKVRGRLKLEAEHVL